MTPQQILKEIDDNYSEYFEMMNVDEKFIIITRTLSQKLAFEIAEKEYYKSCWMASLKSSPYKEINS